jgi:hypothetical protein
MKSADWSPAEFLQLVSSPLKPGDSELRWMLVGLTVAFLAEVVIGNMRGGVGFLVVLSSWLAGLVLFCVAMFGFFRRRYSEAGSMVFMLSIVLFPGWAGIAFWVAVWTWSPTWPTYQLGLIQASAIVPLLAATYLISRRLASAS